MELFEADVGFLCSSWVRFLGVSSLFLFSSRPRLDFSAIGGSSYSAAIYLFLFFVSWAPLDVSRVSITFSCPSLECPMGVLSLFCWSFWLLLGSFLGGRPLPGPSLTWSEAGRPWWGSDWALVEADVGSPCSFLSCSPGVLYSFLYPSGPLLGLSALGGPFLGFSVAGFDVGGTQ